MKIDIYSHHFCVTEVKERHVRVVEAFCRTLILWKQEWVDGKKTFVMGAVFAASNQSRSYYRFHINNWVDFKLHMGYNQVADHEMTVTQHDPVIDNSQVVEFEVKELKAPWKTQPLIIDNVMSPGSNKVITLQTGGGKACRDNTPVQTPFGWEEIGHLQQGDYVIAKDGSITEVTGVYPQGEVQLYKVTFADDRWVEVCGDHMWRVYYVNTLKHKRWRTVNTLEVMRLISLPNPRVYIDLPDPYDGPEIRFPIDPYTLGVLIGDGALSTGVGLATADDFILDKVESRLPAGLKLNRFESCRNFIVAEKLGVGNNAYRTHLTDLGLMGKRSWEKFIPPIYLRGSKHQRLELLQGLLDTDGTVSTSGSVSYSTVSHRLARDIQKLARSLGNISKIHLKQTQYPHLGEVRQGRPSYYVSVRSRKPTELTTLPRKHVRSNDTGQYSQTLKLKVMSVVPTEVASATCISVAHPEKLFVVKDYIVTHNTTIAKHCMARSGVRTVVFMKGGYIDQWLGDCAKTFHFKRGEMLSIRGFAALNALMENALDGPLDAKLIFVSINTYSEYIKEYERSGVTAEYPIAPQDFYKKLGIGFMVLDEAHQLPHQVMKLFLYTHVHKVLNLSATLDTRDKFMQHIYNIMYPQDLRFDGGQYDAFIRVKDIRYKFFNPKRIKCVQRGAYSHNAFEASLMTRANAKMFENYEKLICCYVDRFVEVMSKGQSMFVFFATINFCTHFQKVFAKRYPHLKSVRYVGSKDKRSVVDDGEIISTTVQSAGTAIDKPNLRIGFMTNAMDTQQGNDQVKGRTRRLVDFPDIDPEFWCLTCLDLPKHLLYTDNRKKAFQGKIASWTTEYAPIVV